MRSPPPKLAADAMLGGLAKWLRLLGLDTIYLRQSPQPPWPERILLTRRSSLPHQPRLSGWPRVVRLKSNDTIDQLKETVEALGIRPGEIAPLTRCSLCNTELTSAPEENLAGRAPEYVLNTHKDFKICPVCRKIYWPGTHPARMKKIIDSLW